MCIRDSLISHRTELDFKSTNAPYKSPVNGLLPAQSSQLCIHHFAVSKINNNLDAARLANKSNSTLATYFEGLEQVDETHVFERTREPSARSACYSCRHALLGPSRQQQVDSRRKFTHENRFCQVIFDSQLKPAYLVLNRALARQKYYRYAHQLGILFQALHELKTVHPRQTRVCQYEIRRRKLNFRKCIHAIGSGSNAEPRFSKTNFEYPHAARVCIHEK